MVCIPIDNSDVIVSFSPLALGSRREKRRERVLTQGVSHFLGWQEHTVAYGNKRNIDAFRALGSGYQQENRDLPQRVPHNYDDRTIASMLSAV